MKISGFNERMFIEKSTVYTDDIGNHLKQWEVYHSGFCHVNSQVAHETEGTAYIIDDSKLTFTLRWQDKWHDLDAQGYRIQFKEKLYNIIGIDCMNYKRKYLKIYAQKMER